MNRPPTVDGQWPQHSLGSFADGPFAGNGRDLSRKQNPEPEKIEARGDNPFNADYWHSLREAKSVGCDPLPT
jgi:hypothetical protein